MNGRKGNLKWLLALDLGTNSIGWWAYKLGEKDEIVDSIDGGVRLFPDGREPSSLGRVGDGLAVTRRIARGMRRNRDRHKWRIDNLIKLLTSLDLLPKDKGERDTLFQTPSKENAAVGGLDHEWNNPYRLRAAAVEGVIGRHELGRVLVHLAKRRGFQSNRKEAIDPDKDKQDEQGVIQVKITSLNKQLGEGQTLGQYLWKRYLEEKEKNPVGTIEDKPKPIRFAAGNDFFAERKMYKYELDKILEAQKSHIENINESKMQEIRDYILEQLPLKPVERGRCRYFTEEYRHWADTPIGHDFRIYQELNNLQVIMPDQKKHPLSEEQRTVVLEKLMAPGNEKHYVKFSVIRTLKDKAGNHYFPRNSTFNLESDKRDGLNGHKIHSLFFNKDNKELLGPLWKKHHSTGDLDDIFEVLHQAADNEDAISELTSKSAWGISKEQVMKLVSISLSSSTGFLSRKAMTQLVKWMRDEGMLYDKAVSELHDDDGVLLEAHHSKEDRDKFDSLPYYGQVMPSRMMGADPTHDKEQYPEKHYGKIGNPTVHIALNQLRLLVNTLIDRFGCPPTKINSEVTRELKLPKKLREQIEKEQAKNQKRNRDNREEVRKIIPGREPSITDIHKYLLWKELGSGSIGRPCPYTGKNISCSQLYNGDVDIEHILPFSRTLDDSLANKTVAFRFANQLKGNDTPYDAFSNDEHKTSGIVWKEICDRIKSLPSNKQRRFQPDAMERYDSTDGGFIARQLTDTAYISTVANDYLKHLNGVKDVITIPGRLTAKIRWGWGFNKILADQSNDKKNRDDHRHHAIDAAVVGQINRGLLQKISKLHGNDDKKYLDAPCDRVLNETITERVRSIIPSYKPDHGLGGKIFQETAYGFVKVKDENGDYEEKIATRKQLSDDWSDKEISQIADIGVRTELASRLEFASTKDERKTVIGEFAKMKGIRSLRVHKPNDTDSVKPIASAKFKGYMPDSFICCDIWRIPMKKKKGDVKYKFHGKFWSFADVNFDQITQAGKLDKMNGQPHPAAKFVTRLFKDDLIQVGLAQESQIYRVAGFSTTNNMLNIVQPELSEQKQNFKSINVIGAKGLRRLHITPDGRLKYKLITI